MRKCYIVKLVSGIYVDHHNKVKAAKVIEGPLAAKALLNSLSVNRY